jgi:hypothetical protein
MLEKSLYETWFHALKADFLFHVFNKVNFVLYCMYMYCTPVELDRSRSNVRFLVRLYVDELMFLMAVHVECTSTVP